MEVIVVVPWSKTLVEEDGVDEELVLRARRNELVGGSRVSIMSRQTYQTHEVIGPRLSPEIDIPRWIKWRRRIG